MKKQILNEVLLIIKGFDVYITPDMWFQLVFMSEENLNKLKIELTKKK